MTVKELIEELNKYNDEDPVLFLWDDAYTNPMGIYPSETAGLEGCPVIDVTDHAMFDIDKEIIKRNNHE